MLTVTKKFSFCYGHYLPDYDGKCKHYHGHNSEVEVEVGEVESLEYPGMIMDFSKIKKIVSPIIEMLDHRFLNDLIFGPPTAENIVLFFVQELKETEIGPGLVRVRITETPTSWAEWRK